jgi:hypothetical protein
MYAAASPRAVLATLLLAIVYIAFGPIALHAQTQERGTLDRILHPDRSLKYDDADRKFDAPAAEVGKQAAVHPFLFGHGAAFKGDGVFQTRAFGSKSFRTGKFATKPAFTKEYDENGKLFAVRALAVNEDRDAGKTMDTHTYMNAEKPYLVRGKRQDSLDEISDTKNMTIAQVRELLNKPK